MAAESRLPQGGTFSMLDARSEWPISTWSEPDAVLELPESAPAVGIFNV
jgi:hypothetical protein